MPTAKLFIEEANKKWKYRYTTKFSFSDIAMLFREEIGPKLLLHARNRNITLTVKPKHGESIALLLQRL